MVPSGPNLSPDQAPARPELKLVTGGGAPEKTSFTEAERWKGWTAVLLAVILVLLTSHMAGFVGPDPDTARYLLTDRTGISPR